MQIIVFQLFHGDSLKPFKILLLRGGVLTGKKVALQKLVLKLLLFAHRKLSTIETSSSTLTFFRWHILLI